MGTIQRVFRDMGLPRLRRTRKREPRQMRLFEKAEPGESVQVDVKYVRIAGRWAFQYTARVVVAGIAGGDLVACGTEARAGGTGLVAEEIGMSSSVSRK